MNKFMEVKIVYKYFVNNYHRSRIEEIFPFVALSSFAHFFL
jgi:hypothetical protein